jgi:predicted kinase
MTAAALSGCVLVNGMPGAGKSTVTTLAARLLPRAARVKGDDVNAMILSGRVGFAGDPPEEAARQVELCHRNMCSLAANFVDFDFTVLVDTVVADRAELGFLLGLLAPRQVRLVTLAPGSAVCRQRNATRNVNEQFAFDDYERLDADMRQGFGDLGWWFDTSALDPIETAERIVRDAARFESLTVAV